MTAKTHGRSGRPWRELRLRVLAEEPYCQIRGEKCRGIATTVDHVVPLSIAPELAHERSNLRAACGPCNYAGGARMTNSRGQGQSYRPPPAPSQSCPCRLFCQQPGAANCCGITAVRL